MTAREEMRRAGARWAGLLVASVALASGCDGPPPRPEPRAPSAPPASGPASEASEAAEGSQDERADERLRMVREQLEARDVHDPRVLAAMRAVPRHRFVPPAQRALAYADRPLPIEAGQTISQPYIVALMTQLADVSPGERVLEVGTGSGYQAAVLAELGAEVYSIEIVDELARSADARLKALGYDVTVRSGDGYAGWPEHAPFAAIVVTAAPPEIPDPLRQQLAIGGRLVVPVGQGYQDLVVITRSEAGYQRRSVIPVRFVPMTGKAQR